MIASFPPDWIAPVDVTSPLALIAYPPTPRCAPVIDTLPELCTVACRCAAEPATDTSPFDDIVRSPAFAASCASARTPIPAAVLITWIWPAVIAPNAVASIASERFAPPFAALIAAAEFAAPFDAVPYVVPYASAAVGATNCRPAIALMRVPAYSGALMPIVSPIRSIVPTVPSIPAPGPLTPALPSICRWPPVTL